MIGPSASSSGRIATEVMKQTQFGETSAVSVTVSSSAGTLRLHTVSNIRFIFFPRRSSNLAPRPSLCTHLEAKRSLSAEPSPLPPPLSLFSLLHGVCFSVHLSANLCMYVVCSLQSTETAVGVGSGKGELGKARSAADACRGPALHLKLQDGHGWNLVEYGHESIPIRFYYFYCLSALPPVVPSHWDWLSEGPIPCP